MAEQTITSANASTKQQIVVLEGEAFVKDARGQLQPIKAGDTLLEGQVIATSATGHLTILLPNGQIIELGADRSLLIDSDLLGTNPTDSTEAAIAKTTDSADQIINALNQGKDLSEELDATAAGLNAGASTDEGSGFVRLMRIAENLDPISFDFSTQLPGFEPLPELSNNINPASTPITAIEPPAPSAGSPSVSIPDTDGSGTGTGTGTNTSDSTVSERDGPVAGSFNVSAPDGIKEINVGGTVITAVQLATLSATPITINTGEGSLQLTGFDAATGKVTYSYDPSVQANVGGKDVIDNIAITVTDKNNVVGTDSLDIAIQDTVPTANADTNSIVENTATTSGNVILGDAKGGVADLNSSDTGLTLTTAGTFVGKYGTLVIAANGTYTYTLDNANPTVNALNPGQSLTDEVFNYTVRDADGSTSSASLNITVNGASDGGPTVSIPDTDGNAGANASDKTVVESDGPIAGDFSVTAPDGIKEINVGGTIITAAQLATLGTTPITINTGEGSLQLTGFDAATGKVTYSYDPSVQANVGGKDVIDNIAITVTDKNNVVGTDSLDIAIQDTVPTANADSNSILENTATTSGNVILGDAKGGVADTNSSDTGLTLTTAGTFVGKYGTLVIAANGTYTYTLDNANPTVNALNPGQSLTDEVFNYTVRDADGSTSTAALNITVNGASDGGPTVLIPDTDGNPPTGNVSDKTVVESDGPIAGFFTVNAPDSLKEINVGGTVITAAQLATLGTTPITINTGEGSLQLTGFDAATGKGTYTYDPNVQTHIGGKDVIDTIAITVTDKNNVMASDNFDIAIQDTTPTANNDSNSILENTATTSGNVILGDAKGGVADTNSSDTGLTLTTAGTFIGKYGTLIIAANGTYTYTLDNANPTVNALNPGQSLTDEVFNYTVRDADGSTSTAALNITVNGASDGGPTVSIPDTDGNAGANASDKTVVESDGPIVGDFSVTAPDGIKEINVGGTVITAAQLATLGTTPITINTGEGSLQLTGFNAATGKVTYSYDPSVQTNVGGKDVIDTIAITVTDKNNVVGTDSLDIAIQDTVPTANADSNSILENTATTSGNVILGDAKGGVADTNSSDTGLTLTTAGTFVGKYGTLVIAANGTYTYTLDNANPTVNALNPGQSLTDEVFNYTVRDADGSTSSAALNITVNGASDGGPTVSIPDTDGNAGANASDKTVVESDGPVTGDFSVTAPDGIKEINVGGTVITAAQLATLGTTPITINTGEGSLQLTGFDAATGKVTYSYDPSVQANVGGKDVIDNIAITVTDKNNVV
ncbi:beta strand repeat-containing protein, partial [Deefgea rivuli]|uniref:beta strand repeat-containing protein n=1 Tax=Deefgea rivuli TaxID=400948 RepID=UPI0006882E21